MSEMATPSAAPVASSTPSAAPAAESTAPVAASAESSAGDTAVQPESGTLSATEQLEGNIAEALRALDEPESRPATAEATPEPAAETADDIFNREHELEQGFHKKRDNRIPHKRVVEMVNKAQAKLLKELTGADLPAGTSLPDFLTQQKTARTAEQERVAAYQQYVTQIRASEEVIRQQPIKFLQTLVETYPDVYGPIFGAVSGNAGAAASNDGPPEPDLHLGNGQYTYSPEGLQRREAWLAQQIEQKIAQRYEPLAQRYETEQRQAALYESSLQNVRQQTAEVTSLPGFAEHEAEIVAALKQDTAEAQRTGVYKLKSLRDAYFAVMLPKMQADRTRMRQELLEEQNRLPRSTSATGSTPARRTEENDLDARIASAIKGL